MDRFSAYLLIRRFLRRSSSRNRALAIEAIMEELARRAGQPPEAWGVLGLLSQLDLEYAEGNPDARGVTAREQAELEGLDGEEAASLGRWCSSDGGDTPVEHALILADALAAGALDLPTDDDVDDESPEDGAAADRPAARAWLFPDELAARLERELELARQRGDVAGERLDRALEHLGIESRDAGQLALGALRRAAQDLR
jgi:hypothetical protein